MNRVKDYFRFAAWFCGIGYFVLWPMLSSDFAASSICAGGITATINFLCQAAPWVRLPPALHAIGIAAAVFVTVRVLTGAVAQARRNDCDTASPAGGLPSWKNPPPSHYVKPRREFGLRGNRPP